MSNLTFDGTVGSLGELPQPTSTVFTISRPVPMGMPEHEYLLSVSKLLGKGIEVISQGIVTRKEDGSRTYHATLKSQGAGIPNLGATGVTHVFMTSPIYNFDGVRLFRVKQTGKTDKLTFLKWVCGDLKTCDISLDVPFTEDHWASVNSDFAKQEAHIMARKARGV